MLRVGRSKFFMGCRTKWKSIIESRKIRLFSKKLLYKSEKYAHIPSPLTVAPLDYAILVRFTFSSNLNFHKKVAFIFGLQTLWLIDFTRIYQLKGLESKKQKQHELLWMLWIAKKHNLAFVYIGRQHFHQLCHSFIVCYNDFM